LRIASKHYRPGFRNNSASILVANAILALVIAIK